jgi:hypothetical protein
MDVLVRGPEREVGVERRQIAAAEHFLLSRSVPSVSSLRELRVNFLIGVLSRTDGPSACTSGAKRSLRLRDPLLHHPRNLDSLLDRVRVGLKRDKTRSASDV